MKKYFFIPLLALLLTSFAIADPPKAFMDSISGKSFNVIQSAMPEANRVKLDVAKYKIFVMEGKSSYVVLFDDPNRLPGQLGSSDKMPSFEVEVSKDDLHIVRANFVR